VMDEKFTEYRPTVFSMGRYVLNGIPQGSVLRPILFVLYINDLPDNMISEVFMFADDTKVFREIRSNEDIQTLHGWINVV